MSFLQGMVRAYVLGTLWNSQKNPPKVYYEGNRIHHYQLGIVMFLTGVIVKNSTLAGLGAGLFLHDIDDVRF